MNGGVGILNVGAGDTKLSFDPSNPAERIRAARIVKDMIRRGYALLIETTNSDGVKSCHRAVDFDESICSYIIADFDPITAAQADAQEGDGNGDEPSPTASAGTPSTKRRVIRRGVKAESTSRAVAVAPSAGG